MCQVLGNESQTCLKCLLLDYRGKVLIYTVRHEQHAVLEVLRPGTFNSRTFSGG